MVNADDILLDDGSVIEHASNVVGGGSDNLDAPLKRLVVGLGPDKCRQERVVNIDEVLRADALNELMREHLHVTRQHDQGALMLAHQSDLFLLCLTLVFFADRYDEIRHSVEVGDPLVVGVVGNYQRNIAMQFATLLTVEQVLQAMVVLRDENGDA